MVPAREYFKSEIVSVSGVFVLLPLVFSTSRASLTRVKVIRHGLAPTGIVAVTRLVTGSRTVTLFESWLST